MRSAGKYKKVKGHFLHNRSRLLPCFSSALSLHRFFRALSSVLQATNKLDFSLSRSRRKRSAKAGNRRFIGGALCSFMGLYYLRSRHCPSLLLPQAAGQPPSYERLQCLRAADGPLFLHRDIFMTAPLEFARSRAPATIL